jgi:surfeit locus 1 family protein
MKIKAEPKLANMAKNAIATMNFMSAIISLPRTRAFVWVTLAMLAGVTLTVRLGFWQLSRASEKERRHSEIMAKIEEPALKTATLLADPTQFSDLHRRVVLQGEWMPEDTIYLDNRPMNGRAGFWVLTPLKINETTRVLVQRGWVPRHRQDRTLLPDIQTPPGVVTVQGRISSPPSNLMELGARSEEIPSSSNEKKIRQNLDIDQYANVLGKPLAATVLQTDLPSDGLLRDWPEITVGVEKNLAYAFQWFALAALQLVLYLWFQFIQPYRHARRIKT